MVAEATCRRRSRSRASRRSRTRTTACRSGRRLPVSPVCRLFHVPKLMPTLLSPPSPEYAASPRSTAGQIGDPGGVLSDPAEHVLVQEVERASDGQRTRIRIAAARILRPCRAACQDQGCARRCCTAIRAWLLTLDIESIHSSAIRNLRVEKRGGIALDAAGRTAECGSTYALRPRCVPA